MTRPDTPAPDFTWGSDCGVIVNGFGTSEWCLYQEPHQHGYACDVTCPCKTDESRWRWHGQPPNVGQTSAGSDMTDLNTPIAEQPDNEAALAAVMFRLQIALGHEPAGNPIEGYVFEFNPEAVLTEAETAIAASQLLPSSAADVWDKAIAEARTVINRRKGTYEADIDLLALENPYR